jgi:hypothetical protein
MLGASMSGRTAKECARPKSDVPRSAWTKKSMETYVPVKSSPKATGPYTTTKCPIVTNNRFVSETITVIF